MAAGAIRVAHTLHVENRALAWVTCERIGGMEWEPFHRLQINLWFLLSDTERDLRRLRKRVKQRNLRLRRSSFARRASSELRRAHLEATQWRISLLEERHSIVKQFGDMLAWGLARGDPRYIAPFFKPSTHQLPEDHSADGVIRMLEAGAASQNYLVVACDLTRCCGTGDFLILGKRWPHPSAFEAKVKKQLDGSLLNMLHGNTPAFHVIPDEKERFAAAFGMEAPSRVSFDERGERQKREIDVGVTTSFESFMSTTRHENPGIRRNWGAIERVIERAIAGGSACDLAEPGVVYVVMHADILPGAIDPQKEMRRILEQHGTPAHSADWRLFTSAHFLGNDELSALVSPIAGWKLPVHQRVQLMTRDVILGSAIHKDVWAAAFRRRGVEWSESEAGWKMSATGRELVFDQLDVARLRAGLAFAGISPSFTAAVVSSQLYDPGSVEVDRYPSPDGKSFEFFERKRDSKR